MPTIDETLIFRWEGREERSFVTLRYQGGQFRVAWGVCDPPRSDNVVEQGQHTTTVADQAVDLMLQHIGILAAEPDEVSRVEPRLRDILAGARESEVR